MNYSLYLILFNFCVMKCYLEFFSPKQRAGNEVRSTELLPSYDEVQKEMI